MRYIENKKQGGVRYIKAEGPFNQYIKGSSVQSMRTQLALKNKKQGRENCETAIFISMCSYLLTEG